MAAANKKKSLAAAAANLAIQLVSISAILTTETRRTQRQVFRV
jgi:hypothetical protein